MNPPAARGANTCEAIYLGPMAQIVDDGGTIFRKGVATPIDAHARERIANGPMKHHFVLRDAAARQEARCCGEPSTVAQPVVLMR